MPTIDAPIEEHAREIFSQDNLKERFYNTDINTSKVKETSLPKDSLINYNDTEQIQTTIFGNPNPVISSKDQKNPLISNKEKIVSVNSVPDGGNGRYKEMLMPIHSPLHASSVAVYVVVFLNLYKKFALEKGDENSQFFLESSGVEQITERDIKLLQIAALLHDSKRPADGDSKWQYDEISAKCCKEYLIKVGSTEKEAQYFGDIISNKEPPFGALRGKYRLLAKVLHDADALDIIRVYSKEFFKQDLLCFFQEYCQQRDAAKTNKALKSLSQVVMGACSFIEASGNQAKKYDWPLKLYFELAPDCYAKVAQTFSSIPRIIPEIVEHDSIQMFLDIEALEKKTADYSMIRVFFNDGKLLTREQAQAISTRIKTKEVVEVLSQIDQMQESDPKLLKILPTLMKMGIVFNRSISLLSRLDIELEKTKEEGGNSNRSVSTIGYGAYVATANIQNPPPGFVIINTNLARSYANRGLDYSSSRIKAVFSENSNTGCGEKPLWKTVPYMSNKQVKEQLKKLREKNMDGFLPVLQDQSSKYSKKSKLKNDEIIMDITPADKIYVCLYSVTETDFPTILDSIAILQKLKTQLNKDSCILYYSQNSNNLAVLKPEQLLTYYIKTKVYNINKACSDHLYNKSDLSKEITEMFDELNKRGIQAPLFYNIFSTQDFRDLNDDLKQYLVKGFSKYKFTQFPRTPTP